MVGKMLGKYCETKVWEQLWIIHIAHGKDRMRVVSRVLRHVPQIAGGLK